MEDSRFVARTPCPECPACQTKKLHTQGEYRHFHPLGGHGRNREQGVCCQEMMELIEKETHNAHQQ